ncbi:hypothetical protein RvY_01271 [Ramazzottius varieornatus]|uniref:EamA domain-containing protein n=1 Tax=Ramazzottius varieornatus TaxID=947166 RepID=A0A1D1UGM1_RAMVA|nr:hypothetical protein RvY_01271 [Ramazzottius varieornatus]
MEGNNDGPVRVDGRWDGCKVKISSAIERLQSRSVWIPFLLGQVCSTLLCGTAVTSTYLMQKGVNCPTAQSFLNYLLIGVVYSIAFGYKSNKSYGLSTAFRERWWKYLILAVIDVEGNYLMVKAYHYTTLTSVQLLDCTTIPVVLILSCVVLQYRFRALHYIGVILCVAGAVAMVFGDLFTKKSDEEGANRLMGDLMVLGGSVCYGFSNVAEEYVVKTYSRLEYLSLLGIFGSVVNGIQLVALEKNELGNINWIDWEISLYFVLFAMFLFALYSLVPYLMRKAGATIFNLSILSADFYALVVGLTLFRYEFHYMYFIGFILVVSGLIIYSIQSPRIHLSNEVMLDPASSSIPEWSTKDVVLVKYLELYDSRK